MSTVGFIIAIYAFMGIVAIGILIYLIIRRNKIKKTEDFEKRDY